MEIHAFDSDLTSASHRAYMDSLGWSEIHEISGSMMRTGIRCAYSEFLRGEHMLEPVIRYHRNWHYFMENKADGDPAHVVHEWPFEERFDESRFVTDKALHWLRARTEQAPFFLQIGYYQPNHPRDPLPRFFRQYRIDEEPLPGGARTVPPEEFMRSRLSYRAEISQLDEYIGQIHDWLLESGEIENTVLIYTSDHGCSMYERYGRDDVLSGEAYTNFFEGAVHVPLIFTGTGIPKGVRSPALVETLDIGRTLCDWARVSPHALDQGKSLGSLLRGETEEHRRDVVSFMGCDQMLFDGRYKLMWGDPKADRRNLGMLHLDKPVDITASPARLYDLQTDPHETRDLIAEPSARDVREDLLRKLLARINANRQMQPFLSRGEYRPIV
jgi:arylsulfatase A-like enzyme